MRYGTPMQSVLLVGAAVMASSSVGLTHQASCANCDAIPAEDRKTTAPSFRRQQMLRGTGYAKQRRAAQKRRRQQ